MNPNEAVAGEVAAPAANEAAAPAAGQESVGVGAAGPDGLPVATPVGSAAAGVQLGTLPSSKTLLSSKIRRVPSWLHPARGVPRWPDPVPKKTLS